MRNRRRLRILIDMDDVMESLIEAWVDALNCEHGLNVTMAQIVEWDIEKPYPTLTKDEIYRPLKTRSFWETVEPKPGAAACIQLLKDDGHEIFVCTSSHYETIKDKVEVVLLSNFPFLEWEDVIVTARKDIIRADVLIDDGVHNLVNFRGARILMDAPHNQSFDEKSIGAIRVRNWPEAYCAIDKIARKKHKHRKVRRV